MGELQRTIDEITIYSHKLIVATRLIVCPSKVIILGFGSVSCQYIAKLVLTVRHICQILVEPDSIVFARRYLVTLKIEKLVARHIIREDIFPMRSQHGWEDYAVKDDIILTDKMNETGLRILPPCLPTTQLRMSFTEFLSIGDISYRGIKPHVEHLALRTLHWYGYTPVQISRHSAWAQTRIEPTLALAVHIAAPLLVLLKNPFLQPLLILVEGEIPMLRLSPDQRVASLSVVRVDQFLR